MFSPRLLNVFCKTFRSLGFPLWGGGEKAVACRAIGWIASRAKVMSSCTRPRRSRISGCRRGSEGRGGEKIGVLVKLPRKQTSARGMWAVYEIVRILSQARIAAIMSMPVTNQGI